MDRNKLVKAIEWRIYTYEDNLNGWPQKIVDKLIDNAKKDLEYIREFPINDESLSHLSKIILEYGESE